jgi:hypothetical protein
MMELSRLVLSGGLGNQLFQYAYALDRFGPNQFEICDKSGQPRTNKDGLPELFSFNLSEKIVEEKAIYPRIRRMAFDFFLKLSSHGKSDALGKFLYIFVDLLQKIFNKLGSKYKIHLADGIGFFHNQSRTWEPEIVVGCFHSYVWATKRNIRTYLQQLELKIKPPWLIELENQAKLEAPVIVHIRRTDYLGIAELGFLDFEYYWTQMRKIATESQATIFWLFTDNFDEVLDHIPPDLSQISKLIDYDQEDAASNLMAMRLGKAYILSNSTFSWWGAFLSFSNNPLIRCPDRWYRTGKSPNLIFPPKWELVTIE